MKHSRIPGLLAALLILFGGCDNGPTVAEREGRLAGLLDGEPWVGTALTDIRRDTIFVGSSRRKAGAEQRINLAMVESSPGAFTLVPGGAGHPSDYRELVGGDLILYHADITGGTVAVEHFDRATGELRGTLSFTIQGTRGTARFEQGELRAVRWHEPGPW